jgi:signal transduction histidine kinase
LQLSLDQLRALAARLQNVGEEESKRLAREIHVVPGQALTAIKIDLRTLIREMGGDPEHPTKRAASILKMVDDTIESIRQISTELRPGILDTFGLVAGIE